MEEKKNQVSAKLGTVIIIVVLLIIALTIAIVVLNKKTNDDNNTTGNTLAQNNSIKDNTQTINPEVVTGNEIVNQSDLTMSFLKLENEKKNMIYSPLSIKYALSMLNEGASGNTKAQIEKLIKNTTLTKYENQDKVLSLANSIYIRDTYKQFIKEDYKNTLVQKYQAEVQYDSFKNAKNVNQWIEQKTLGIIKDMIKDETMQDPYTKLLLINALAIDMEWKSQFDAKDTGGGEFKLVDGSTMQATMMHKKIASDSVAYYKDNKVTALTMDLQKYGDTQLEFLAIMPNDEPLSEYLENVTIEDIDKIASQSINASKTKAGVNITIPKFAYNYNLKLKEDLQKLGMTDAFDGSLADLTKMADTELNLFVGDAMHKADIQFTEKGVKAAAVTVFVTMDNAMIEQVKPEEVIINKPFLYVIRDKNAKEVWFVGTMYEPNSWEKDKVEYEKSPI